MDRERKTWKIMFSSKVKGRCHALVRLTMFIQSRVVYFFKQNIDQCFSWTMKIVYSCLSASKIFQALSRMVARYLLATEALT